MSKRQIAFRMTVYGADDVTPLTPITGAAHTSPFQVATIPGVTGFEPYMGFPEGRRGRLDPLEKKRDTGELMLRVLDKKVAGGTGNAQRWITAFVGDEKGRQQLIRKKVVVEISTDGGTTWNSYFTGRIWEPATDGRLWISLRARDTAQDMKRRVFVGRPHDDILGSYAVLPVLSPLGLTESWGPYTVTPRIRAKAVQWDVMGHATGIRLDVYNDQFGKKKQFPGGNIITKTLYDLVTAQYGGMGAKVSEKVRARVKILTGTRAGEEGHFFLEYHAGNINGLEYPKIQFPTALGTSKDGQGHRRLRSVGLRELQTWTEQLLSTDPNYMALPPAGADVEFDLVLVGEPMPKAPLILGPVHPFQLWKDLLDGKFGRLKDGVTDTPYGDPSWTLPYDSAAFTAFINDASFQERTYIVEEPADDLREWVEENICKPENVAWTLDADGQVVPKDLRLPTSLSGVPTLTDDDLDTSGGDPPTWNVAGQEAISQLKATYYLDRELQNPDIMTLQGEFPDIPPSKLISDKASVLILDLSSADKSGETYEVDATGFRAFMGGGEDGEKDALELEAELQKALEEMKGPYVMGPGEVALRCRRTTTPLGLAEGDLTLAQIAELPDSLTNERGGTRLFRVLEKTEERDNVILFLLDQGDNQPAAVPGLGTPALVTGQERNAVEVAVTLNAAGDPAELEYALTDAGVSTAPADDSGLWTFEEVVKEARTVTIHGLAAGKRVWLRARSLPQDADRLRLPSAWVSAGPLDLHSISAPSGILVSDVWATMATVSWTVEEEELAVEVWLASGTDEKPYRTLPAGSKQIVLTGLASSTSYTVKLRYRGGFGGYSSFATAAFSTTTSVPIAPDLKGMAVVIGRRPYGAA